MPVLTTEQLHKLGSSARLLWANNQSSEKLGHLSEKPDWTVRMTAHDPTPPCFLPNYGMCWELVPAVKVALEFFVVLRGGGCAHSKLCIPL